MYGKISIALLLMLGCSLQSVYTQSSSVAPPAESSTTEAPVTGTTEPETTDTETTVNTDSTQPPIFSCSLYPGMPIDLKAVSGEWFETARAPQSDASQCLKYSLANTPDSENKVGVEIDYINAANSKWEPSKETIQLPWDDNAKNGIFVWNLGGVSNLAMTFKLLDTDNTTFSLFCGYVSNVPTTFFKILTRQRELAEDDRRNIQGRFAGFRPGTELSWVEQSNEKCNSAMRSAGGVLVALALVLLVRQRYF